MHHVDIAPMTQTKIRRMTKNDLQLDLLKHGQIQQMQTQVSNTEFLI